MENVRNHLDIKILSYRSQEGGKGFVSTNWQNEINFDDSNSYVNLDIYMFTKKKVLFDPPIFSIYAIVELWNLFMHKTIFLA